MEFRSSRSCSSSESKPRAPGITWLLRLVRLLPSELLELLNSSLNRSFPGLVGADPDRFVDVINEHLTVADFPGLRRLDDGDGCAFDHSVGQNHLDLDFRKKINRVLAPSIDLSVAFLAPESFYFRDRHSLDSKV